MGKTGENLLLGCFREEDATAVFMPAKGTGTVAAAGDEAGGGGSGDSIAEGAEVATMSPDLNGAGADPGAGAGINGGDARGAGVGTGGSGGLPRDSPWRR